MLKFWPDFNSYTALLAIDNGRIASEGNGREDQQRKSVLLLFAIFNGITRAHIEAGAIYFPLCIKSPSGGHRDILCRENSEKQEEFSGGWCRGRQINEVCIRLFGTVTFLSYAIIILCLFYFSIRRVGAGSSSSSTLSPVVIMFDDEGFVLCELSCGWWEHDKWFPNGNLDKKGISAQLLKRVCNMRSSSVFNGFSFSSHSLIFPNQQQGRPGQRSQSKTKTDQSFAAFGFKSWFYNLDNCCFIAAENHLK